VGEVPRLDEPGGTISIRRDLAEEPRLVPAADLVIGIGIGIAPPPEAIVPIEIGPPPGEPIALPFCTVLRPILPPVKERVGRFDLVATGATPIAIDVRPARSDNFILPGSADPVPVAILGDADLDVRDIDETSLRLGDGEAAPVPWRGRELAQRRDVDG